jgi:hypothetical protein
MLRDNQEHFFTVKPSRLIRLSNDDLKLAEDFSLLRTKDKYPDTRQTNFKKLYADYLVGSLVELATYRHLPDCPPPDLNYYEPGRKSWREDFTYGEYKIGCKGQWVSQARKFGMSWTYQYNSESYRRDSGLNSPEGFQVYGIVKDEDPRCVAIKAVVYSCEVIPHILDLPKMEKYQDSKRVVYYAQLEESIRQGAIKDLVFSKI